MKNLPASTCWRVIFAGLALAASSVGVSSFGLNYIQNFDSGGSATNFANSGSVAGWIYWYNTPGTGGGMTNDVSHDQGGGGTNGGSLYVLNPFLLGTNNPFGYTNGGTQNVFFGTFDDAFGYDFNTKLNLYDAGNISFYIMMAPGAVPRMSGGTNADFGSIGVGVINANYGYQQFGVRVIPLAASNNWVPIIVPVDTSQNNLSTIPGIAFDYNNYGGYPTDDNENFFIDTVQINPGIERLPPQFSPPRKPVPGLNCIASTSGPNGQYNREQICTVADTGYTFVGQPSVTYSWDTTVFPLGTGVGGWQQHFFIVNGAPGPSDQASDYNLPDVFWVTVQQNDVLTTSVYTHGTNLVTNITDRPGTAIMNFRYKTNEPGTNAMLFNTASPTDTVNNPHGWPIEPVATLAAPAGAVGTWSVTVADATNLTISGPGGVSTNFNIDPAVAALFADPCTLILGAQPNVVTTFANIYSVYGRFSATGCATPINDNFLTDTILDTTTWRVTDANDTNGVVLVQPTAAFWVPWSLPDAGFVLQTKAGLNPPGGWTLPTVPVRRINGHDVALLDSNQLPSISQGYFQMLFLNFTQLQVLVAGETNAPNTLLGYTGSAAPVSISGPEQGAVQVQINAVDSDSHILPGIIDKINLTSSADPNAIEPLPANLVNGTLNTEVEFTTNGSFTVTATDVDNTNIVSGTSSPVTITP